MANPVSTSTPIGAELREELGDFKGALKDVSAELKSLEREAQRTLKKGGVVDTATQERIASLSTTGDRLKIKIEAKKAEAKKQRQGLGVASELGINNFARITKLAQDKLMRGGEFLTAKGFGGAGRLLSTAAVRVGGAQGAALGVLAGAARFIPVAAAVLAAKGAGSTILRARKEENDYVKRDAEARAAVAQNFMDRTRLVAQEQAGVEELVYTQKKAQQEILRRVRTFGKAQQYALETLQGIAGQGMISDYARRFFGESQRQKAISEKGRTAELTYDQLERDFGVERAKQFTLKALMNREGNTIRDLQRTAFLNEASWWEIVKDWTYGQVSDTTLRAESATESELNYYDNRIKREYQTVAIEEARIREQPGYRIAEHERKRQHMRQNEFELSLYNDWNQY